MKTEREFLLEIWNRIGPCERTEDFKEGDPAPPVMAPEKLAALPMPEFEELMTWYEYREEETDAILMLANRIVLLEVR